MRSLHARWLLCSAVEWYSRTVLQSVRNGRAALDMALEGLLEGHHRHLKAVRRLSPRESGVERTHVLWRMACRGEWTDCVCGMRLARVGSGNGGGTWNSSTSVAL